MNSTKAQLESNLPIYHEPLTIRLLLRSDMDLLLKWPDYPWPYDTFRLSFSGLAAGELDRLYESRARSEDRITLVAGVGGEAAIGYIALLEIDWPGRVAGNMSVRLHPAFCNHGIGSRLLIAVRDWWFGHGMKALRLDVAATNQRAVRCYLNAGFRVTGEFWRDAPELTTWNQEQRLFLGNHVDWETEIPRVRFCWMEAQNGRQSAGAEGMVAAL